MAFTSTFAVDFLLLLNREKHLDVRLQLGP
jgi:hypothetical protein